MPGPSINDWVELIADEAEKAATQRYAKGVTVGIHITLGMLEDCLSAGRDPAVWLADVRARLEEHRP